MKYMYDIISILSTNNYIWNVIESNMILSPTFDKEVCDTLEVFKALNGYQDEVCHFPHPECTS